MPFMFFDPLYIYLVLPAVLLAMLAQFRVSSSFKKYSQEITQKGVSGADAACEVLRRAGIDDVRIERVQGHLADHYDPRENVIRLSEAVHDAQSVAAVGVAAHEAGHAIQYAHGYFPIRLRMAILPVTNIGSKLALPLVLIGILFEMMQLVNIGILLFGTVAVFQLITLPVEFNASRRAITALSESGLLTADEIPGSKKVLSAAALTYVGALAVSLAQLLRFVMISRRRR
ncbi:MAG: zinc metallopeptidase [Oscillospiraceae bacterium]|nr:zinc metallopeptidase [Oscillospiraceae bacterium]